MPCPIVFAESRNRLPRLSRMPQRTRPILLLQNRQTRIARHPNNMPAVMRRHILHRQKRHTRICRCVKPVQIGQIRQPHVNPIKPPARKVIAPCTRTHMREMKHHINPLIHPIQIALILPHIKPLACNPLKKRGKSRYHIELRLVRTHRQTIGNKRCGLLFNTHLKLVIV